MTRKYLSLCAIVRDQEHYIKEWLAFHRAVGVEKFYLRLNDCDDRTFEKIRELPFTDDVVVYHDHPKGSGEGAQPSWYRFVLREYGRFTKWMMFIDSDEFFFGTKEDHLPTILERYENYGGLAAHWIIFGHNKRLTPPLLPKELSIESFSKRLFMSKVVKSCIQPHMIDHERLGWHVVHTMATKKPIVTENFAAIQDNVNAENATADIVRINHYHYRSLHDYMRRIRYVYENMMFPEKGLGKCWATMNTEWLDHAREEWGRSEGYVDDPTVLRFVPKIRELIQ